MYRRSRLERVAVLALLALVAAAGFGTRAPEAAAHRRADCVLVPQFMASWGDWSTRHYEKTVCRDTTGVCDAHFDTYDVSDMKRWKAVRAAFHELDQEFKAAGY